MNDRRWKRLRRIGQDLLRLETLERVRNVPQEEPASHRMAHYVHRLYSSISHHSDKPLQISVSIVVAGNGRCAKKHQRICRRRPIKYKRLDIWWEMPESQKLAKSKHYSELNTNFDLPLQGMLEVMIKPVNKQNSFSFSYRLPVSV